jgi:hypothetical protein
MMSVILLVLGILVTGLGVVAVGFGIPINDLGLGQTLIIAGATALVGGLILIGLAAAVSQLAQIAEALKGRPATRTARVTAAAQRAEEPAPEPRAPEVRPPEPRAPEPRPEMRPAEARALEPRPIEVRAPEPRAPEPRLPEPAQPEPVAADSTVAVSASAIERLRSTMGRAERQPSLEEVPLSPNGGQPHVVEHVDEPASVEVSPVEAPPEPRLPEPVARLGAAVEAKEPRLDFLFRSRPARPAPQERPAQRESFDSMWPKRGGAEQAKAEEPAPVEERRPAARPAAEEQRSVAILKSGVVDGMAYTLYADGSIEAQLPQGTVRFGSIAELRAHIENNS